MAFWIVSAAIALFATPFVLLARRTFARDRVISGWPRAPGVMTHARIESATFHHRDRDGRDIEQESHRTLVAYTYTVAGQELQGSKITRDDGWTGRSEAEALLAKYPPERKVEVLYDPADPTTAYLESQRSTGAVILLAMGCFFFLLSAVFAVIALLH